jgi:hypothetical protein
MWMWSNEEKLKRLIKSMTKMVEFKYASGQSSNLTEEVAEEGFAKAQQTSQLIIEDLEIQHEETKKFILAWIQVGLFSGFLAGYDNYNIAILNAAGHTAVARKFAADGTENIFGKLLAPPVSPLLEGLSDSNLQLLQASYESSLYAGFLEGLDYADRKAEKLEYSLA